MTNTLRRLRHRQGILFASFLALVIIQFFWVYNTYMTLEVDKVFEWILFYVCPVILCVTLIFLRRFRQYLFAEKDPSGWQIFKNSFSIIFCNLLLFGGFTFSTIIQTNDWFGSEKYEYFNQEIIHVEKQEPSRKSKLRVTTYDVEMIYKGRIVTLNCKRKYNFDMHFVEKINVGGAWGILYSKE